MTKKVMTIKRIDSLLSEDCCGCTACQGLCPKKAITMVPDSFGFAYPIINEDLCINCGICYNICQFSSDYERYNNFEEPRAYAARLRDLQELELSQSGGVFASLAQWVLSKDGIVYGVAYSNEFVVMHQRAESIKDMNKFRGSKYVQSGLDNVFFDVKKDLLNDKLVLFSGTPCQISGLKSFTCNITKGQLITIDILCHGVSSPKIWSDYLRYLENKYSKRVKEANMRDKKLGWSGSSETYLFGDKKVKSESFLYLYFSHYIQRDSCFNCPFTNLKRVGDISLGDFWHWEKTNHPEFRDNKGISLVLVNSLKGEKLFDEVKESLIVINSDTNECMQNVLYQNAKPNPSRKEFLNDYMKHGFKYVAKKYGDIGFIYNMKILIYTFLQKIKMKS